MEDTSTVNQMPTPQGTPQGTPPGTSATVADEIDYTQLIKNLVSNVEERLKALGAEPFSEREMMMIYFILAHAFAYTDQWARTLNAQSRGGLDGLLQALLSKHAEPPKTAG